MASQLKSAIIIGAGIAGPVLALFLKRAGFSVQVFEASGGPGEIGGALTIAPNGMNVLAAAGVAEQVRDVSVTAEMFDLENQYGKLLASMPVGDAARYGQAPVLITRAALHRVLVDYAESQGVEVRYGKRLVKVQDQPGAPIVARFADGAMAEGDFLVGADGIRSQVRESVMPEAPKPVYTGMMSPGGFSPCIGDASFGPRSNQRAHFIFGRNGFFGYFNCVTAQGPRTVWWSTVAAPLESREQMAATTKADLQQRLLALHRDWASPIPEFIRSAELIINLAIHDVPSLSHWSAGRTILIGYASHAVAPHSGQGASMALEDTMFLAKLLRDGGTATFDQIFEQFERQRRPRTDRVIALGRRQGQLKERKSRLAFWIEQQMIRIFVPLASKKQDWLLGYKIECATGCRRVGGC